MSCCIFKNCFNRLAPFSNVTFFNIPKDNRRQLWLERSGNEEVRNLPLTARRVVCEAHFEECHIRRQFHRTTLSRDAVPVSYETTFRIDGKRNYHPPELERNVEHGGQELDDVNIQEVPNGSATELEMVEEHLSETEENISLLEYDEPAEGFQDVTELIEQPAAEVLLATVETQTENDEISSPPKKRKLSESIKLAVDKATNTDPLIKAEPIESCWHEKVVRTEDRSAQTENPPAEVQPKYRTEEEYFLLSLSEPLQRLPPEKRALAKVKMLTYLVQLGCGVEGAQL